MAQEDKGLVLRGLLLLTAIGVLVAFVLAIIFWRPPTPNVARGEPSEYAVAWIALPGAGAFPSAVNWHAFSKLSDTLPSAPGWEVRYNAAATLARRGSTAVPWPILLEMLDEKQQLRNCRTRGADGKVVVDEGDARAFVIAALRAVAAWHDAAKADTAVSPELQEIYKAVDKLAENPSTEIQAQAEKTRATFHIK